MKNVLQLVAVVLLACQVTPASITSGLCFMLRSGHPTPMSHCCMGMSHKVPSATVQAATCSGACCYVSPQNPQVRISPRLITADAAQAPAEYSAKIVLPPDARDNRDSTPRSSAPARYVLLKTFRI